MKTNTTRAFRQKAMSSILPEQFESAEDFFIFLHLNDRVKFIHAWSFVAATVIFIFSILHLSWQLFILQYLVSTLPSVFSHYLCDGYKNRGPVQKPAFTLRNGIRINIRYLLGRSRRDDELFVRKYPFVREIFCTENA
jgi:hypothetical protein